MGKTEYLGMCQKGAILLDSVDLAQAQRCQVRLTHAQWFLFFTTSSSQCNPLPQSVQSL